VKALPNCTATLHSVELCAPLLPSYMGIHGRRVKFRGPRWGRGTPKPGKISFIIKFPKNQKIKGATGPPPRPPSMDMCIYEKNLNYTLLGQPQNCVKGSQKKFAKCAYFAISSSLKIIFQPFWCGSNWEGFSFLNPWPKGNWFLTQFKKPSDWIATQTPIAWDLPKTFLSENI
jgi:hypothetical protein